MFGGAELHDRGGAAGRLARGPRVKAEAAGDRRVGAALARVRAAWAPPPDLTVSAFADRELVVTTGPLAGSRWSTAFAPYQRGIMDAVHEPGVEFVVVMGSSQWGKTACAVNVVAYHIAHDPCSILIVEPTVDPMAKDFAKNRLDPMVRACPRLAAVVDKKRQKDASNTVLQKTFRGGFLALAGSNSAASLASRPVRLLVLDEIERYLRVLPGEGSPLAVAIKRTTTFKSRRRVLLLSSPTIVHGAIHQWFERGDRRRYYVPCPACGLLHPYEWRNVRWAEDRPESAHLVCPGCGAVIDEAARVAALARGEWRSEAPARADRSIVSFHLWEAYSPLSTLREMVAGFLWARSLQTAGDPTELHTWTNTTLGEPVEADAGEGAEAHTLIVRREPVDEGSSLPAGVCCLTMGVDVQDDRLEALVLGWGPGEECWIVDRQTVPGDTERPEPWAGLSALVEGEYLHPSGVRLPIQATCVDSAGHRTALVYDYAAKQAARRVFAIIGREGERPIVSSPSPRRWGSSARPVPLYTIGVDAAKAIWMSRFKVLEPGPGYVHVPLVSWADEELAEQLTSEKLVTRWAKGIPRREWVKKRARNDALDCAVYGLAALRLLHPSLEGLAARLAGAPGDPPVVPPAQARPRPWLGAPRRGWLR